MKEAQYPSKRFFRICEQIDRTLRLDDLGDRHPTALHVARATAAALRVITARERAARAGEAVSGMRAVHEACVAEAQPWLPTVEGEHVRNALAQVCQCEVLPAEVLR